jgi:uncharacterized Zn finger protein
MTGMSRTWWGQRFLHALEELTDAGRLARGRTYARGGKVLSYEVAGNTVSARVRGSINPYFGVYKEPIYTISIELKRIPFATWEQALGGIATRASFVAKLLMNEMPDTIDEAFADLGVHLLPDSTNDLATYCSCPDWANPCKHVAGVYYLLAADLDSDPFLLFELRGLSRAALRHQLQASPLGRILSAELTPQEVSVVPDQSYNTVPVSEPARELSHRDFWLGGRRLPDFEPASRPPVPGLVIRRQGDYPAFWKKDISFIDVMDGVYERVRTKSPYVKRTNYW